MHNMFIRCPLRHFRLYILLPRITDERKVYLILILGVLCVMLFAVWIIFNTDTYMLSYQVIYLFFIGQDAFDL